MRNRKRSLLAELTALNTQITAGGGGGVRPEERDEIIRKLLMGQKCPMCRTKLPRTAQEAFGIVQSTVTKHDDWAWAHHQLGTFYTDGTGCQVDMEQAVVHYSKAAVAGHTQSQRRLGKCYKLGRGVTKPCLDQAAVWYQKAANNGCALSQTSLGYIYKRQDMLEEAASTFGRAAEQGVDVAQCALARCYEGGVGVGQSWEKSLYWYKQAADQGNSKAMARYASALMKNARIRHKGNVNVPGQSPIPEALCWAKKSLTAGNAKAKRLRREITRAMKHKVCTQCQKPAGEGERLAQCSACRAVTYCGVPCQRAHWIAGHKMDCCNSDGRKIKRRRITET
jgi:TPR repeat protein